MPWKILFVGRDLVFLFNLIFKWQSYLKHVYVQIQWLMHNYIMLTNCSSVINYILTYNKVNISKLFSNKLSHTDICLWIYLIAQSVLENTFFGIHISLNLLQNRWFRMGISYIILIIKKISVSSATKPVMSKYIF